MEISEDSLLRRITPAEVEVKLAEDNIPDLWLWAWRAMLDRMTCGDELWEYWSKEYKEYAEVGLEPADEILGFSRVRDSEIPDPTEKPSDWMITYLSGFAVVRDGEILDWIEASRWSW